MSVPGFQKTLLPILQYISDGQPHRPADTVAHVQTQFELSEEDLVDRLPNGRTRLMDRVLWAITYLRKSGLLESISWGVFRITSRGKALLAENPKSLDLKDLERYPEYLEFKGRSKTGPKSQEQEVDSATVQETPEEELERTYTATRTRLEGELLDALKTSSPIFFEKVVLALLVSMGYGGSIRMLPRPQNEPEMTVLTE